MSFACFLSITNIIFGLLFFKLHFTKCHRATVVFCTHFGDAEMKNCNFDPFTRRRLSNIKS